MLAADHFGALPIWVAEMGACSGDPTEVPQLGADFPFQSERQQAMDYFKRFVYPLSFEVVLDDGDVFACKFIKDGRAIYAVWWDYFNRQTRAGRTDARHLAGQCSSGSLIVRNRDRRCRSRCISAAVGGRVGDGVDASFHQLP